MRLFIATSFPETVTSELNQRLAALKPRLPPASWVRPAAQHLTFAFLGEQEESLIENLAPGLEECLRDVPKFSAALHGYGFFPNSRSARAGWIGLDPEEPFGRIAHVVRKVVTVNGIELDRSDFRAHLTVMRIKDRWPPASIEMFERSLRKYRSAAFVVDTVTLFSSRLDPAGAVHTPVRQFTLA